MNYQDLYDRLIARARDRVIFGYCERHHVVPRCLGGSDDEANLISLTAEEHFVAHLLLVKLNPGHLGILSAAHIMASPGNTPRPRNKIYGWLRQRMAEAQTGQKRPPEVGAKIGARLRGRKRDAGAVAKGAAKLRGKVRTPDMLARRASLPRSGEPYSAERLANMAEAQRGKKQSPATIAKRIAAMKVRYEVTPKPRHTEETRARMRASRLANIAKTGSTMTVEARAKVTAALKGRPRPPEVIARCVATRARNKAARLAAASNPESIAA